MREIPIAVKKMRDEYGKEFKEIFDVEVNRFAGELCLFGILDFDIIEFDRFMKKKGYREGTDGGLADYIEKNYGERGREIIDELISMDVEDNDQQEE